MSVSTRSFLRLLRLLLPAGFTALVQAATAPADRAAFEFELESPMVGRTSSGPAVVTDRDAMASGAQWVRFESSATGDWMQFTLPNLPPGRYQAILRYQGGVAAGHWRIEWREADGSAPVVVNPSFDFALPASARKASHREYAFRAAEVGVVTNALPGYRTIRFTRLDAGETPGPVGFDALTLQPAPAAELVPPTPELGETGPTHQVLLWSIHGLRGDHVLIERSAAGEDEWLPVGYAPLTAGRFESTGLLPETVYRHRLRAFAEQALGTTSPSVEAKTAAVGLNPLGAVIDTSGDRIGEGSIVRLKDGRLVMFLNYQDRTDDFAPFTIVRKESRDNGATWSPAAKMLHDESGQTGYMMPSLLRLQDGTIGFSYAVRNTSDLVANRVFQISKDEGVTWSNPVVITHDLPVKLDGLTFTGATGPHDRLIQAENGDLLLPVHITTGKGIDDRDPAHDNTPPLLIAATVVYRSTDGGASWQRVFGPVVLKGTSQRVPYLYHIFDEVLSEPSLVEYAPGRLLLMMRNQSGFILQARSLDGGTTWSPVHTAPIRASIAPPKLLKVGPNRIALIFNPYVEFHQSNLGGRFALGSLVSEDGGLTWHSYRDLDVNPPDRGRWLCYPFFFRRDDAWLAFYFGPNKLDLCFRQVPADWFDRPLKPTAP